MNDYIVESITKKVRHYTDLISANATHTHTKTYELYKANHEDYQNELIDELTTISEKTREDTIVEVRKTIARSLGYSENSDLDPSPQRVITESELFEIFYKLSDKESKS